MGQEKVAVLLAGLRRLPAAARRPDMLRRACRLALGARPQGEVSIVFVRAPELRRINKTFLGHDYDTDVIAFGYQEGKMPRPPGVPAARGAPFGDVYISIDQAKRQARQMGHPLLTELLTLTIHGALHLIGYDDHEPRAKARMFKKQELILRQLQRS